MSTIDNGQQELEKHFLKMLCVLFDRVYLRFPYSLHQLGIIEVQHLENYMDLHHSYSVMFLFYVYIPRFGSELVCTHSLFGTFDSVVAPDYK